MKNVGKIVLYGFLLWLIPFLVSFPIFTLRESNRALFESIMPVAVTIAVVVLAIMYIRKRETFSAGDGLQIGIIWFIICILIDLPLFIFGGPMKMSLGQYMADIGLTYVIIPTVTVGYGYLVGTRRS